ncbi:MAG: transketolase [Candidatus Woesearchaeota archaeon]
MKGVKLKKELKQIRKDLLIMLNKAGSGHTAGPLGMAEIFYELYFNFLNINPKKPLDKNRDYLILSNGHICPILYTVMAHRGFFKKEELLTLRKLGSRLQGHPQREHLNGLETTSGPLGSGLSQACGISLGLQNDKKSNKVICLTSDGEHGEGNTWEAVLFAKKHDLKIINIIDRNYIQIDGNTEDVLPLGNLKQKYESFGWEAVEIDGNDLKQIKSALKKASYAKGPFVIVANTTPGKGVSFMENNYKWHGKTPSDEELKLALEELK